MTLSRLQQHRRHCIIWHLAPHTRVVEVPLIPVHTSTAWVHALAEDDAVDDIHLGERACTQMACVSCWAPKCDEMEVLALGHHAGAQDSSHWLHPTRPCSGRLSWLSQVGLFFYTTVLLYESRMFFFCVKLAQNGKKLYKVKKWSKIRGSERERTDERKNNKKRRGAGSPNCGDVADNTGCAFRTALLQKKSADHRCYCRAVCEQQKHPTPFTSV